MPMHEDETPPPSTGPGPGQPTGETLPGEAEPTGAEELAKEDVGFGPKGDEDTGDESLREQRGDDAESA
jgi:hypothetical protein